MRRAIHQFHQTVHDLLPDDVTSVLEAGCGEGFSAEAVLGDRSIPSFGGDLSFDATREARIRFESMRYSVLDVTRLPFTSGGVDAVFSLEVLEHLPKPELALQEYARVARKYVLLSVPNEPFFRSLRFLSGKNLAQWGDHPEHIQHWFLTGFRRFVESSANLHVIKSASPFPFAWSILLCQVV